MKKLPIKFKNAIEKEIKMLLHASRDCLRNQKEDTLKISFSCGDPYYCEAFGIMRALQIMGYGQYGPINIDDEFNLNFWFNQLCDQVLKEEGFYTNHQCDHCYEKYRKDDSRKKHINWGY